MQGRVLSPLPMGNLCDDGALHGVWCAVKDVGRTFQAFRAVGR